MKLQIFIIKRLLNQTLIINCLVVIRLDSAVKKDENYYPQVFLKECKYIGKKVVRHIHDNLSNFSSSSYESDEEQFKTIRFKIFENIFFEGAIS